MKFIENQHYKLVKGKNWLPIGRKYVLLEPLLVSDYDIDGSWIVLEKGFSFNGANGIPNIGHFRKCMRAAAIHDAGYSNKESPLVWFKYKITRGRMDRLFLLVCKEDGIGPVLRAIMKPNLRWFGGSFFQKD